jgi:hypothetical protein
MSAPEKIAGQLLKIVGPAVEKQESREETMRFSRLRAPESDRPEPAEETRE